jgi:hypothetical protein
MWAVVLLIAIGHASRPAARGGLWSAQEHWLPMYCLWSGGPSSIDPPSIDPAIDSPAIDSQFTGDLPSTRPRVGCFCWQSYSGLISYALGHWAGQSCTGRSTLAGRPTRRAPISTLIPALSGTPFHPFTAGRTPPCDPEPGRSPADASSCYYEAC